MKRTILLVCIVCVGCASTPKAPPVHVSLTNYNKSVKFQGLDPAILGSIQRDSIPGIWQTLIPVYRMPADTDLKDYQPPQPGKYEIKQNTVIFTPDTSFVAGQIYFMRCYRFDEGKSVFDILRNKRKLGDQPYSDLTFRGE